jgi:hypothetical protein
LFLQEQIKDIIIMRKAVVRGRNHHETHLNNTMAKHGIRCFLVKFLRCWNRGAWAFFFHLHYHSHIVTLDSDAFLLP